MKKNCLVKKKNSKNLLTRLFICGKLATVKEREEIKMNENKEFWELMKTALTLNVDKMAAEVDNDLITGDESMQNLLNPIRKQFLELFKSEQAVDDLMDVIELCCKQAALVGVHKAVDMFFDSLTQIVDDVQGMKNG